MKNYSDYPQKLALQDNYETDPSIPKSNIASLLFYWRVLRIVLFANGQTKKKIYDRYNWVASSLRILKAAESVGIKVDVSGMKNLTKFDGPAVIVGNHMSTLETLILPSLIQPVKTVVYVIKKELTNFPLFGPVAAARHPIIVGRENPREDLKIVMEEGSRNLQMGRSVIIFPQKTRSPIFDHSTFNSLGIKLAKKNNVPVIPLALITDAWGNGKYIKEMGKIDVHKAVHLEFGEAMKVEGNGSDQHEAVIKFITDKFKQWGSPELLNSPPNNLN